MAEGNEQMKQIFWAGNILWITTGFLQVRVKSERSAYNKKCKNKEEMIMN